MVRVASAFCMSMLAICRVRRRERERVSTCSGSLMLMLSLKSRLGVERLHEILDVLRTAPSAFGGRMLGRGCSGIV